MDWLKLHEAGTGKLVEVLPQFINGLAKSKQGSMVFMPSTNLSVQESVEEIKFLIEHPGQEYKPEDKSPVPRLRRKLK